MVRVNIESSTVGRLDSGLNTFSQHSALKNPWRAPCDSEAFMLQSHQKWFWQQWGQTAIHFSMQATWVWSGSWKKFNFIANEQWHNLGTSKLKNEEENGEAINSRSLRFFPDPYDFFVCRNPKSKFSAWKKILENLVRCRLLQVHVNKCKARANLLM